MRWDLVIQKFQTDIAIISNKSVRYRTKYELLDTQIKAEISQVSKGSIAEKMLEIWTTDIFKEEAKSHELWKKTALF